MDGVPRQIEPSPRLAIADPRELAVMELALALGDVHIGEDDWEQVLKMARKGFTLRACAMLEWFRVG